MFSLSQLRFRGYLISFESTMRNDIIASFAGHRVVFPNRQPDKPYFQNKGQAEIPSELWQAILQHVRVIRAKTSGRIRLVVSNPRTETATMQKAHLTEVK